MNLLRHQARPLLLQLRLCIIQTRSERVRLFPAPGPKRHRLRVAQPGAMLRSFEEEAVVRLR